MQDNQQMEKTWLHNMPHGHAVILSKKNMYGGKYYINSIIRQRFCEI